MSIAEPGFVQAEEGARKPLPVARILHWAMAIMVLLMAASGIIMTQLGGGKVADVLFGAHKLAGAATLLLLGGRLAYRLQAQLNGVWAPQVGNRLVHFALYVTAMLVPLLGWAGISDFGARGTLFGITLPSIWPEGAGYDGWLLSAHAWLAFGLLGLVVLHIGVALQDYVMRGAAGRS